MTGGRRRERSEVSVVYPVIIGRKPAGALLARFAGDGAAATAESAAGVGRLAASLLGIVLRGARALEPIRERTRRITLPDAREERRVRAIERYRDFIDSASDGIVVLDGSGAVLYLNRAAEEVTGYARDGLAGKPIVQIVARAVPRHAGTADRARHRRRARRQLRSRAGDHVGRSHHRLRRVDRHPVRARDRDLLVPRRHAGARAGSRAAPHQRVPEPHPELDGRRDHRREHARHDPAVQPGRGAHLRLQGQRRDRPHVGAQAVPAGHRPRGHAPHPFSRARRRRPAGTGAPPPDHGRWAAGPRLDLGGARVRRRGARDRDRRHLLGSARAPPHGAAARLGAGRSSPSRRSRRSRWSWPARPRTSSTSR